MLIRNRLCPTNRPRHQLWFVVTRMGAPTRQRQQPLTGHHGPGALSRVMKGRSGSVRMGSAMGLEAEMNNQDWYLGQKSRHAKSYARQRQWRPHRTQMKSMCSQAVKTGAYNGTMRLLIPNLLRLYRIKNYTKAVKMFLASHAIGNIFGFLLAPSSRGVPSLMMRRKDDYVKTVHSQFPLSITQRQNCERDRLCTSIVLCQNTKCLSGTSLSRLVLFDYPCC